MAYIQYNPKVEQAHMLTRKLEDSRNYPVVSLLGVKGTTDYKQNPQYIVDSQNLERLNREIKEELRLVVAQENSKKAPEVKNMALDSTNVKDAKKNLNRQYNEKIAQYRTLCAQIREVVASKKEMRELRAKLDKISKQETLSAADETFVRQYL